MPDRGPAQPEEPRQPTGAENMSLEELETALERKKAEKKAEEGREQEDQAAQEKQKKENKAEDPSDELFELRNKQVSAQADLERWQNAEKEAEQRLTRAKELGEPAIVENIEAELVQIQAQRERLAQEAEAVRTEAGRRERTEEARLSKEELNVLGDTGASLEEIRAMTPQEARATARRIIEAEREARERVESITGVSDEEARKRLEEKGLREEQGPPLSEEEKRADRKARKKPASHAERRREATKRWEEMPEEERQEKYGKTFELRERVHALHKARVNLAVLEEELNSRSTLFGRFKERLPGTGKATPLEDLKEEFKKAEDYYGKLRAEYVGAKAWRLLKEKTRAAEDAAREHERDAFERFRKAWRWLGDQNLEKVLVKKGHAPASKLGKLAARMVSLRAGLSIGLFGAGIVAGVGTSVGIAAIAARRGFTGVSTGFGSYDMMRLFSEKRTASISAKDIETMGVKDIEEKMAELEALSKFSGERIVHGDEYRMLRRRYREVTETAEDKKVNAALLQELDGKLREAQAGRARKERRFKAGSAVVGLGAALGSHILFDRVLKGTAGAEDIREGDVQQAVEGVSPALTAEQVQEAIEAESSGVFERSYSPFSTEYMPVAQGAPGAGDMSVEELRAYAEEHGLGPFPKKVPSESLEQEFYAATGQTPPGQSAADMVQLKRAPEQVNFAKLGREIMDSIKSKRVATIGKGSNIWDTMRNMVKSSVITQEEFQEAWVNPNSLVELPSGRLAHISDVGLVHEGDQVVVALDEAGRPMVTVMDVVRDGLRMADNVEYAKGVVARGNPLPQWLKEAVADRMPAVSEVPATGDDLFTLADAELVEQARAAGQTAGDVAVSEAGSGAADSPLDLPGTEEVPGSGGSGSADNPLSAAEVPAESPQRADVLEQAARGALEGRGTYDLGGVEATLVYAESGQVADVIFENHLSPAEYAHFAEGAVRRFLRDDYVRILERAVPDSIEHVEMPRLIGLSKEAAAKAALYDNLLEQLDPESPEYYLVRYKLKELVDVTEKVKLDARIFNYRAFGNLRR